jgi:hypothetical protein
VKLGYDINLEEMCRNQAFSADQVISAQLVFPKGAVPNAQIIWVKIELSNLERKFVTLPLSEFYRFVSLPESSIGGWTDGDRGSDNSGHFSRYAIDHSGGSEEIPGELQRGAKGDAEIVEA